MKKFVLTGVCCVHAWAFGCEVADEVSIVGDRLTPSSIHVVLRTDETLPDSPKMPGSVRIVALPSGKVEKRVPLSSDEKVQETLTALRADGFSVPPAKKWKEARSRKSDEYRTSHGVLKFDLIPTKDDMILQRTLTFTPRGKRPRIYKDLQTTSKSATETSQIRKVWEAPNGKAILVVFGNCSEEVYALTP